MQNHAPIIVHRKSSLKMSEASFCEAKTETPFEKPFSGCL